jgi:hypothetical protein
LLLRRGSSKLQSRIDQERGLKSLGLLELTQKEKEGQSGLLAKKLVADPAAVAPENA